MFKLKIVSAALLCGIVCANASAKDDSFSMTPPKALDNKVYDSMVGTWTGQSDMMGEKSMDTVKIRWALNHQFLIMELKSHGLGKSKTSYEGMGVFGVDQKGNPKTWWFDSWGAGSVATGEGRFKDNTLEINDGNEMFKETRTFTMKGNEMVMKANGTMTMNGKETPFDQTTVYKKK